MALRRIAGLEDVALQTYGELPPLGQTAAKKESGLLNVLKTIGGGLLGILTGGQNQPANCPACPPTQQSNQITDIVLPLAVGVGIAYLVKKL